MADKKENTVKKEAGKWKIKKNVGGRPTLYKAIYNTHALKLTILGATDKDLADFFEVNTDSIYEWKKRHPKFSESIRRGKIEADSNVATSLYKRANGYKFEEKKTDYEVVNGIKKVVKQSITEKSLSPDTTAAIFWLKNRQPKLWRDTKNVEINTAPIIKVVDVSAKIIDVTPKEIEE